MATAASVIMRSLDGTPQRPPSLDASALIVVDLPGRSADALRFEFPACEQLLLVLDHETGTSDPIADVSWITPIVWPPADASSMHDAVSEVVQQRQDVTAVFLSSFESSSGRLMDVLRRAGVRRFVFDEGGHWRETGASRGLTLKVRDRVVREFRERATRRRQNDRLHLNQVAFLDHARARRSELHVQSPPQICRVDQFVGCLHPGGAERQACYVARGLAGRGISSRVLTSFALFGAHRHYLPMLEEVGVEARQAGTIERQSADSIAQRMKALPEHLLASIPQAIRASVFDLYAELVLDPPQVLNCWLDYNNIIGAIAGVLADVPGIVVSTRNVNPTAFPAFHQPWMRSWYQVLTRLPWVRFVANSEAGAADYATWLNISRDRFRIVRNAVDLSGFDQMTADQCQDVRDELRIDDHTPLLTGVFRLSPEKRPDRFVELVARLRHRGTNVKAVLVGDGPLRLEVHEAIARAGLDARYIELTGRRSDVEVILGASDVVVLTSDHEGTPNCLLEAMAMRRPVVSTDAGGVAEVVDNGVSGFVVDPHDLEAMVERISQLLEDPALRTRMGEAGRQRIESIHREASIIDDVIALYDEMLTHDATV